MLWSHSLQWSSTTIKASGLLDPLNPKIFNLTLDLENNPSLEDDPCQKLKDVFQVDNETCINFKDLARLPEEIWKLAKYPQVHRMYPPNIPLRAIVEEIKAGKPPSVLPKHNFPIHLLFASKSVCNGDSNQHASRKYNLVVIVKSGAVYFERRKRLRKWARQEFMKYPSFRVGLVFILGLPSQRGGRVLINHGVQINLDASHAKDLRQWDGKANEALQLLLLEIEKYDDIILADFEDTYLNLTRKDIVGFRWASTFCRGMTPIFLVLDDDYGFDLGTIRSFILSLKTHDLRQVYIGTKWINATVRRNLNVPNAVTRQEIPWPIYWPYLQGFAQLIGVDVMTDMAIGLAYMDPDSTNEDTHLGMLATKLEVKMSDISKNEIFAKRKLSSTFIELH